jgi:hypothetical protein
MTAFPLPDDTRCTGTTSIDDGVTRHETECPAHPATDELPEWIGGAPVAWAESGLERDLSAALDRAGVYLNRGYSAIRISHDPTSTPWPFTVAAYDKAATR